MSKKNSVKGLWPVQFSIVLFVFFIIVMCTVLDIPESKEMTEQIDWPAKQPSQAACVPEDLKCWVASGTEPRTWHHRSPGGEMRRKRKRSTIFLERTRKGNIGIVPKATLGKLLRDGVKRIPAFPSAYISFWTELIWTGLNWIIHAPYPELSYSSKISPSWNTRSPDSR